MSDQPQYYQDEQPRTERRLGERAERRIGVQDADKRDGIADP
jgi:hypothetical protein